MRALDPRERDYLQRREERWMGRLVRGQGYKALDQLSDIQIAEVAEERRVMERDLLIEHSIGWMERMDRELERQFEYLVEGGFLPMSAADDELGEEAEDGQEEDDGNAAGSQVSDLG